jgi:peptidoglycan/xylan/chitin deacetylase (PgdA/CDA1 family)
MYHSISEPQPETDVWELEVHPDRFEEQMVALVDRFDIISIAELGEHLRSKRLRPNTVAITFDDGYANNVTNAGPVLRRLGIPATLFLCTGFLDRPSFWWHELLETVVYSKRFPQRLPPALTDAEQYRRDHDNLRSDPHIRRELALRLWRTLRLRDRATIDATLASLRDLFEPLSLRQDLRPLKHREVTAALTCFAIGAHSVTHLPLSTIEDHLVAWEVVESQRVCEALSGKPVRTFAYPYGEFSAKVARFMSRHMDVAFTTGNKSVTSAMTSYEIPRVHVGDWYQRKLIDVMCRVSRHPG